MEDLVARLEALERGVYSNAKSSTDAVVSENLVGQVALIEHEKLSDIIDADGDLERSRRLLGIGAKTELILLNDSASQTISDMRTISALQSNINQPEYTKAAEQQAKTQVVEQQHSIQAAEFRKIVADVSSVIDRYYAETEVLSEMFIQWDQTLTAIERKVAEMEASSRKQ
ncbi:hypothetical protein IW140_001274 [Coemansia sp. RSA 1813]|nr:hypothetical protein EV178_001137 [Coemansia sp. RSA 1646]KAJ1771758.1 hypothetical protein LPJ74_002061 [Coemansia sp. RSA 1843]KAJ2091677.1 hypothetical protein IW138_001659 [Coemansia sp. RSA 986]KAJ2571924.1 hypothetical protein IW140_001274 [Coemansia sp. RSA 1813]